MSKEKGKREAQKELKSFKSEFKKVITLNSNLQAQIEAMSSNRLMCGSNVSSKKYDSEMDLTPSQKSSRPPNYHNFKTVGPAAVHEPMKENFNMYMTSNLRNDNSDQSRRPKTSREHLQFPAPPFVRNDEGESEGFFLSSMMQDDNLSDSSNNELANIIVSHNKTKNTQDTTHNEHNGKFIVR